MAGKVYEELFGGVLDGGIKSKGIPCASGAESEEYVAAKVDRSDESVDWSELSFEANKKVNEEMQGRVGWGGTYTSPIPERVIEKAFKDTAQTQTLKDSGTRQTFSTGAVRDAQQNKGRFDLIPPIPLLLVGLIYEMGARKYADRNWEKGMPISRYIDSAERHLAKYKAGMRDEPHLSQVLWNIMGAAHTAALTEMGIYSPEFNDLPNHVGDKAWEGCGCGKFTAAGWNAPALSPVERDIVRRFFGE